MTIKSSNVKLDKYNISERKSHEIKDNVLKAKRRVKGESKKDSINEAEYLHQGSNKNALRENQENENKSTKEGLLKDNIGAGDYNMTIEFDERLYEELRAKNEGKMLSKIREWEKRMKFLTPLKWKHLLLIFWFHFVTIMWVLYNAVTVTFPKWQTVVFGVVWGYLCAFGVTASAHRYWCHRSFKATLPLQILMMLCFSATGQNTIRQWVRDHRTHHKHSETAADPHDSRRGLFFAHVGWLMMRKHPAVKTAGDKIDISDIDDNPVVQFHLKYFYLLKTSLCFVIPTLIQTALWDESWGMSILSQPLFRYMLLLNCTWSVNSFAHFYGNKPYDRYIKPSENWVVSIAACGEGWHNYHHTFPWDYKAAELGYFLNPTTLIIDFFAKIGWAYDLKSASPSLIRAVVEKRTNEKGENL